MPTKDEQIASLQKEVKSLEEQLRFCKLAVEQNKSTPSSPAPAPTPTPAPEATEKKPFLGGLLSPAKPEVKTADEKSGQTPS